MQQRRSQFPQHLFYVAVLFCPVLKLDTATPHPHPPGTTGSLGRRPVTHKTWGAVEAWGWNFIQSLILPFSWFVLPQLRRFCLSPPQKRSDVQLRTECLPKLPICTFLVFPVSAERLLTRSPQNC